MSNGKAIGMATDSKIGEEKEKYFKEPELNKFCSMGKKGIVILLFEIISLLKAIESNTKKG